MLRTSWKRYRYRLERRGLNLLALGIPRLPRWLCVKLGYVLGDLAYLFDRRGRAIAETNVACAFVGRYTPSQQGKIVQASYRNFARTMTDLFWAQNITAQNYRDYLRLEGFEEMRAQHARSPGGTIAITVHQGNWEWASLALGFAFGPLTIVTENFKNARLTNIFKRLRELSGHTIIPQEKSILRLLKAAHRGGGTGMLLDLSLHPLQSATIIEGFGLKMCVSVLHTILAHRAGTLLVPVETIPLPDGTCRVIAHPPVEWPAGATPHEIAQRCWDVFEPILQAKPQSWLWPYKHFRYRPRHSSRPYPDYANDSSEFEDLLEIATRSASKAA